VFGRFAHFGRIARLYLGWVALFAFSLAVSATLMNLYLEALGLSRTAIGLFHGASQFGGLILALPAIFFFERIGRRVSLVLGALFASGVRMVTVLSPVPEVIVAAEALSGFGTVIFGLASVSLLADASTNDNRASVFAISDFIRTGAIFIGSVLAGLLPGWVAASLGLQPESAASYQAVLVAAFLVRLLGIVPLGLIAWQRSASAELDNKPESSALPEVRALRYLNPRVLLAQPPRVFAFAVPFGLMLLAEALIFTFFNLLLRDQFGASDALIGTVIGLNALIGSGIALLAPAAARRFGQRAAIVWGTLISAGSIALFGLSTNLAIGLMAVFVQVASSQIARVLYRAYVINVSPRSDYFITSTMIALASNVGPAIGPPIAGIVQEQFGYGPLFVIGVAITAAAALMFGWFGRIVERQQASAPSTLMAAPEPASASASASAGSPPVPQTRPE
jgi:MFS family permease